MAFFDEIGKKLTSVGQDATESVKKATGIAKLNSLISEEEKFIVECYKRLGETFFSKYGASDDADLQNHIDGIRLSMSKISDYRNEIFNLKGVKPCSACGAEMPSASVFCPNCGNKSETVVEPAAPTQAFCVGCGAPVDLSLSFCTNCGTKIEK